MQNDLDINEDTILHVRDVAKIMRVDRRWVYKHAAELGGSKIGKRLFFTMEGIQDALQRGQKVASGIQTPGAKIHMFKANKKGRKGMGGIREKEAEATRAAAAKRHGLVEFLR